ncbi:ATP adenylyltransferase-domain-containing protein [Staphylotrichum tortipilum]|uniref:ATP adenylyltransferase-domain-containing protein n=1 Tax=Staphylotrichum tortipilum TaxID=2831512 RepID=A0AAN6MFF8_9PEZI|nr:ATP adenylyltransferase-domain-containing protein [Staphylotrichum longicolle]
MTVPPDAMARAAIPANLPELVHTAFTRARASGDVLFFPTQATLINVNSIPFQLRFSPSLASKPRGTQPTAPLPPQSQELANNPKPRVTAAAAAAARFNPFAAPVPPLLIAPLGISHNLVLNKFAVVPEHFILATQAFKPQHHLLEREDLEVAWGCGMLPFQTFAERIGEGVDLLAVYKRLYRKACEVVLGAGQVEEEQEGGEARVDYNLAMTRDVMAIAPRVVEGTPVSVVDADGTRREVGLLSLNGTVLAGTALVKKVEEWEALTAEPGQLVELLGKIGVPSIKEGPGKAAKGTALL